MSDPAVDRALRYFRNGYYCSESILRAFNETYNLGCSSDTYKAAAGFGSGLAESGCVCGSVAGAVMVLGLICGRDKNYESERTVYTSVNDMHNLFKAKHTCLCCRVLTKNVKWGSAEHGTLCANIVADAAAILTDIIEKRLFEYLPQNKSVKKIPIKKNPLTLIRLFKNALKKQTKD